MNPVLTQSAPYPFARLEQKKAELKAKGVRLFDFTIGDPLEPTPEFIREAMVRNVPSVSQYPTVAGRKSLREAISRYFQRRFAIAVDPEREIIPCSGAKEAVFHLPFALVDRGSEKKTVVWGEPAYPVYERGAAYAGADTFVVPLGAETGFLLEPSQIPEEVLRRTCLLWVNYPHNPTGAIADRAYFERIMEAARTYDFVVASDETYADMWSDAPVPTLLEVAKERALVIHSLSKRSGMTAYRSGFMAGDPQLIAALKKMRPSVGVASPEFVQAAAEAAWSDDAHVDARRQVFAQKRQLVLELCRELGLDALSGAGLYVWIRTPAGQSDVAYVERLLEEGVVVTPGESFGAAGKGSFRIALVPLLEDLPAALGAWKTAHLGR